MRRISLALEALSPRAPTELKVWSLGVVDTLKGKFLFDRESLASVIKSAADYGNRYAFDYEHAAATGRPGEGISAGSFLLEARSDGLYAIDIRWTQSAKTAIESKQWLYFSPWFEVDKNNKIKALVNIALTNTPATKHMRTLVAASKVKLMDMTEDEKKALIDAYMAALKALTDAGIEVPSDADDKTDPEAVAVAASARALFGGKTTKETLSAMARSVSNADEIASAETLRKAETMLSGKRVDGAPRERLIALARSDWSSFAQIAEALPGRSYAKQMAPKPATQQTVQLSSGKAASSIQRALGISPDAHNAATVALSNRIGAISAQMEDDGDE